MMGVTVVGRILRVCLSFLFLKKKLGIKKKKKKKKKKRRQLNLFAKASQTLWNDVKSPRNYSSGSGWTCNLT